ncbi:CRE_collapsed_G0028560.mRNA.1.CDS.1 [Saccharomyces cerevisiae]|nr:CRE_collapsed_G0028560.mRNA.1.CDS.1 [Saccharomyces cerevisiae]
MSGSFWKFGQDFGSQSPLAKLLNRAFIKIDDKPTKDEEEEYKLPNREEDYKAYKPNLSLLNDLLDDEELYTELMCSNFKLLVYLKYLNGEEEELENEENDSASEDTRVTLPHELEEHDDTRRARIAAEILSADVWPISSALIENEGLLAKLLVDPQATFSIVN